MEERRKFMLEAQHIADITHKTIYIYDVQDSTIHFMTVNDILSEIFNKETYIKVEVFMNKLIYEEDIETVKTLLKEMNVLISKETGCSGLLFFYSTFKIRFKLRPMMVLHKFKPIFINNEHVFTLCSMAINPIKTSKKKNKDKQQQEQKQDQEQKQKPQLLFIYKDISASKQYSFDNNKWISAPWIMLTPREKVLILFYQQGISIKETAESLRIAQNTIRNIHAI